ncbi:hypothetical protein WJX75_001590 [Coccomyxa subellipsoidea]|uniref:DNA helicase n=1 Tax=Coccomyxa subellipsoidea TaxID=248742 RepID=A0ABR2YXH5_9CHLO
MPTYTIRGIEVQFPHEAYDCQVTYMERVITALQEGKNALLESPTGTGKTLCLLCATLAWQESMKQKKSAAAAAAASRICFEGEVEPSQSKSWAQMTADGLADLRSSDPTALPTIIYASRTHSQLAQVMGELRTCGYRPRAAILGSRQQMCLNPGVKRLPGGAMNQACRAHVGARTCSWYNKVESWTRMHPDANGEALDIEELVRLGSSGGPCPFYLSRDMAATAQIVFMPYNYLVDAKIRSGIKMLRWDNAVLVFDEAHNVEGVCSDAASFDLTGALLATALQEVQAAVEVALMKRDGEAQAGPAAEGPNYFQMTQDLRMLGALLSKLEGAIANLAASAGNNGYTAKGEFLFELLAKIGLNVDNHFHMERLLDDAADLLSGAAAEQGRKGKGGSDKLQELADMLRLAFSTAEPPVQGGRPSCKGYRVHVHKERSKSGQEVPTLSYWCFEPGVAMAALCALKVRSILLTSGTLAPLDSFAQELSLDFPVTLENPHVVNTSQVWVGVVPVGPKGVVLNSSYATRTSPAYMEDLGLALANWARIVPDGLLVFFASYTVLEACLCHWKSSSGSEQRGSSAVLSFHGTLWDRIVRDKQAVIEPRRSEEFQAAADDYRAKLKDPSSRGAIFFAVCRGKVSEGLDFSDRAGRAVVITGLPFAMVTDPKVRLKKEVLDEARRSAGAAKRTRDGAAPAVRLTGEAWYSQQATRAVNQAMGRVIRHMHDYGAIILADERFKSESNQRQLSKWLRPLSKVHANFGEAAGSLQRFFADHANFKVPPRAAKPAQNQPRDLAFFGSGRTSAGAGGGSRPGAFSFGGPDLLLSSLANVPSAADASGLPGLPQRHGRLLSALNTVTATAHSGAAARQAAQPKASTLMDDLLLSLDGKAPLPASAAGPSHEPGPSTMLRQNAARPGPLGSQTRPRGAGLRPAQHANVRSGAFGLSSNVCGPPELIKKHQQKLQAAAKEQAGVDATRRASSKLASCSDHAAPLGTAAAPHSTAPRPPPTASQRPPTAQSDQENTNAAQQQSAGGTAAGSAKKDASPKEYLSRLQTELPRDAYNSIVALLKAYRTSKDSNALIDGVVTVLRPKERRHLLPGFHIFIDKPNRPWFARCIRQLLGEAPGSGSQGSSGGSADGCSARVALATGPSTAAAVPKDAQAGSLQADSRSSSLREKDDNGYSALQSRSAVKVVVVVRPLLELEKQKGGSPCVEVPESCVVQLPSKRGGSDGHRFDFDRVYKMSSPGRQMFAEVVQPLLGRFLQGFNTTVFAYGQTGSGKTYTMGTAATYRQMSSGEEGDGIIPRSIRFIFDSLADIQGAYDVSVKVSFIEIYQDDIRDLLGEADSFVPVNVRESPDRGTFLENVQEIEVRSVAEVARLLEAGNLHRAVAAHNLNEHSSRSHAICTLHLEQRRRSAAPAARDAPRFLRAKLHLVDLAGSERAKETGTTGQQFAEGVNINKGLSALGNVIGALSEGAGRKHIPYRDSKLTRLLQDSLGGNSETLMVACVSPASFNFEPTLSTLRYASRARAIQNRVKQNNKYTPEDEIEYLRQQLEERNAMVAKLQSQLDMTMRMLKGAASPDGVKLVLPPHMTSPISPSGLTNARISYSGGGGY